MKSEAESYSSMSKKMESFDKKNIRVKNEHIHSVEKHTRRPNLISEKNIL